jgi:hypothetical protein
VGSFNSHGTKLWGSFLVKRNTVNFSKVEKDNMGFVSFVELDAVKDELQIQKCLADWARGD